MEEHTVKFMHSTTT